MFFLSTDNEKLSRLLWGIYFKLSNLLTQYDQQFLKAPSFPFHFQQPQTFGGKRQRNFDQRNINIYKTGISTAISLRFPLSLWISHLPGLTLILTHNDLPSRHQGVLRATVHSRPRWPAAVRAGAGEKVARLSGPETVLEPEWGKLVKNSPVSSDTRDTGAQAEWQSRGWSQEWGVSWKVGSGWVTAWPGHRLVPGVARSISQIYSLCVASWYQVSGVRPWILSTGHRLLVMKTHSFPNVSN